MIELEPKPDEASARTERGKRIVKAAERKAKALSIQLEQYLAGILSGTYPKITDQEADAESEPETR